MAAVDELREKGKEFIVDGHFCLLNGEGEITRISLDTFMSLNPDAIILLTENPQVIAERRKARDGIDHSVEEIEAFQQQERLYSTEVAAMLGIPIIISNGQADTDTIIDFINRRKMYGR